MTGKTNAGTGGGGGGSSEFATVTINSNRTVAVSSDGQKYTSGTFQTQVGCTIYAERNGDVTVSGNAEIVHIYPAISVILVRGDCTLLNG